MMSTIPQESPQPSVITEAIIKNNQLICSEHHRIVLSLTEFPEATAGQFVHITRLTTHSEPQVLNWTEDNIFPSLSGTGNEDMTIRRAFSISGYSRQDHRVEVELIYRVVGRGTTWMSTLKAGDRVNILGPLGNGFSLAPSKKLALLVAGGVGLPPMIWWSQCLAGRGVEAVVFCGAQSSNLLPLEIDPLAKFNPSGACASPAVAEFALQGVEAVLSTDDGTLGFHGLITEAFANYVNQRKLSPSDVCVFTCGPEVMIRAVVKLAERWGMDCQVCMERTMACGMGTCQSCVLPVNDDNTEQQWQYKLCCTDGPVFDSTEITWDV